MPEDRSPTQLFASPSFWVTSILLCGSTIPLNYHALCCCRNLPYRTFTYWNNKPFRTHLDQNIPHDAIG